MTPDEKRVLSIAQRMSSWLPQKLYYSVGRAHQRKWILKRGEIYFVDLGQNIGSEENKCRPVIVLQADAYNFKSPVFTCAIVSSSAMTIPDIQTQIVGSYPYIDSQGNNRTLCGVIDLGQIKTLAKERICSNRICMLSKAEMDDVDTKLLNALGLKSMLESRDNTIKSLNGKIAHLQPRSIDK